MTAQAAFFVFQKHSVFIPLKFVYPECSVLLEPFSHLVPLHCLNQDGCPANKGCMEILAKRVNYLFTTVVPDAQQLICYFKHKDRPDSIRAGVFTRDMIEPKLMTLNRSAFKKFQREGITFAWTPPNEYWFMAPNTNIITIEKLLVKPNDR